MQSVPVCSLRPCNVCMRLRRALQSGGTCCHCSACQSMSPPVLWGQHGQRIVHPVLAEWGNLAVANAGTGIVLVAPQRLSCLLWSERCATLGTRILLLPSLQPVQSAGACVPVT